MTVSIAPTVKINLRLSQRILKETVYDGFFALVVDGVQRTGKTSYVSKSLAYANGEWFFDPVHKYVKPDFDSVKPWVIFKPKEFLDLARNSKKQKVIN
jgi:hypothetical protein